MIKQVHNPLFSAPETFSKKGNVGIIQPPCERFGCGKREIYAHKKAFPKGFFTSKIRQLQLKRAQTWVGPPSCGRYGCGKRKWRLPNDFKFISVTEKVSLCLNYSTFSFRTNSIKLHLVVFNLWEYMLLRNFEWKVNLTCYR